MKNKKKVSLFASILAVCIVALFGVGFVVHSWSGQKASVVVEGNATINIPPDTSPEETLGATPGTDHYNAERFAAGFARNVKTTSTTGSAATMLESELAENEIFEMMLNGANFTWTLPATSTMSSVIPNPGDSKTWIIRSMTTTTGAVLPTMTILKGTGWDLMGIDANVDIILPNETLQMDCFRAAASSTNFGSLDIVCGMQEWVAAD